MNIFFITGTSGSGKTTLLNNLKKLLPENFELHDFDEIGVPKDADEGWRKEAVGYWLNRAKTYLDQDKAPVICGVIMPSEALHAPERPKDTPLNFIFIEVDDETIAERLRKKGFDEALIAAKINLAHYLDEAVKKQKYHFIVDGSKSPEKVARACADWIRTTYESE